MINNSNYYATDRDIFEALSSKKKKFSKELLIELCHDRGILVSDTMSRESLIEYVSTLPHDYHDFDYLCKLVLPNHKAEKITYDNIPVTVKIEDIKTNVDSVSVKRESYGENFTVVSESENKTIIKVEYTEMDYSMTRLRQRKPKEAFIEVINEDGATKIRRPANERVDKIVSEIISNVKDDDGNEVKKDNIDLSNIHDSYIRTKFFTDLISDLDDMYLHDVKYIKVDNLKTNIVEVSEDNISDDNEEAIIEQEFLGYVKKAALDGEGLLQSEEYQSLIDSGFFISSIVWQSIEDKVDGKKIEFEAAFDNSSTCTGFKYNARGSYNFNDGKFTITKRPFKEHEKAKYFKIIEKKAKELMDEIISSISENKDE